MKLFTTVDIPKQLPQLSQADELMMFGSCFATEMGERMKEAKFRCDVNPYGVLYNPLSIATAIREIAVGKRYEADDLLLYGGCWHSLMHHGDFSSPSLEKTLADINGRLEKAHEHLLRADCLLFTFGTSYVYEWKETGRVVGNCHKFPERMFGRRRLSVEEIVADYTLLIAELQQQNKALKLLFTVSPIRHLRDGLHENQLSKSTLLLAIDELQRRHPGVVFYFPAYELLLDELRDYRFYAEDLVHPSAVAVSHVWERFSEAVFDLKTRQLMADVQEVARALQHKPFHPDSQEYKRFLEQLLLKIEQLSDKYPYLELDNEKELCLTRLNR